MDARAGAVADSSDALDSALARLADRSVDSMVAPLADSMADRLVGFTVERSRTVEAASTVAVGDGKQSQ
jgi:hypothetical protein